jgi:SSS family solute:Na+ symporter
VNLLVSAVVTFALRAAGVAEGEDSTAPGDYHADEESDPRPELVTTTAGPSMP